MMIREIADRATWESFVLTQEPNTFLQSWEWGEVQEKSGEGAIRLGVYDNDELIAVALVLIVNAKRGRHYLIPHGPITTPDVVMGEIFDLIKDYLQKRSKHDKVVALRIAPLILNTTENKKIFSELGFKPAPMHVHAELTWVLDISSSEDKILDNMRKTTRHAIRKAEAAGVKAEIVLDISGLERFWPLYEQTKQRHGFVPWSKENISEQLKKFGENNRIFSVITRFESKDVAAAICIQYGSTAFYYHGASLKLASNIPAAQLVQWAAIKEAKRRGCTRYNFWGIAPENKPNHPFAGITTFKKGFGGEAIDYLHAQDLSLSIGYWKLWLVDSYRRLRRGF